VSWHREHFKLEKVSWHREHFERGTEL